MKVLLTVWISVVLIQEAAPIALIRLPRHVTNTSSVVHTEYEAKYNQKGLHGNESLSTLSGKQQFVHENCAENWSAFAEKCASLIKELVASLANVVSSNPGDSTNLQLQIKNTFRHFDNTHNCTCLNHTGKGLSAIDLSHLFNNITITTLTPNTKDVSGDGSENCGIEGHSSHGSHGTHVKPVTVIVTPTSHDGDDDDDDEDDKNGFEIQREETEEPERSNGLIHGVHPSNSDDDPTNNSRREAKYPQVLIQPGNTVHDPTIVYIRPNSALGNSSDPGNSDLKTNNSSLFTITSHQPTNKQKATPSSSGTLSTNPELKSDNSESSLVVPRKPASDNYNSKRAKVVKLFQNGETSESVVKFYLPSTNIPVINSISNLPESTISQTITSDENQSPSSVDVMEDEEPDEKVFVVTPAPTTADNEAGNQHRLPIVYQNTRSEDDRLYGENRQQLATPIPIFYANNARDTPEIENQKNGDQHESKHSAPVIVVESPATIPGNGDNTGNTVSSSAAQPVVVVINENEPSENASPVTVVIKPASNTDEHSENTETPAVMESITNVPNEEHATCEEHHEHDVHHEHNGHHEHDGHHGHDEHHHHSKCAKHKDHDGHHEHSKCSKCAKHKEHEGHHEHSKCSKCAKHNDHDGHHEHSKCSKCAKHKDHDGHHEHAKCTKHGEHDGHHEHIKCAKHDGHHDHAKCAKHGEHDGHHDHAKCAKHGEHDGHHDHIKCAKHDGHHDHAKCAKHEEHDEHHDHIKCAKHDGHQDHIKCAKHDGHHEHEKCAKHGEHDGHHKHGHHDHAHCAEHEKHHEHENCAEHEKHHEYENCAEHEEHHESKHMDPVTVLNHTSESHSDGHLGNTAPVQPVVVVINENEHSGKTAPVSVVLQPPTVPTADEHLKNTEVPVVVETVPSTSEHSEKAVILSHTTDSHTDGHSESAHSPAVQPVVVVINEKEHSGKASPVSVVIQPATPPNADGHSENTETPGAAEATVVVVPDVNVQSDQPEHNHKVIINPTTFQTTSVDPTTQHPLHILSTTKPHIVPHDSDESLITHPKTTSDRSDPEDEDDDCCSCEACTEEEITNPIRYKDTACKNLEEARRELKKIFDKMTKKLQCGKSSRRHTVTTTIIPTSG